MVAFLFLFNICINVVLVYEVDVKINCCPSMRNVQLSLTN